MNDRSEDADGGNGEGDWTREQPDIAPESRARRDTCADDDPEQESASSRGAWGRVPRDPDAPKDLGYDVRDWERFQTLDDTDQVMFLPEDESSLKEDAFVVAHADSLTDLHDAR